jgi:hypothetical protein
MPQPTSESTRSVRLSLCFVTHILRFVPARALHIGMLIITIMAFAGPGAEDDSGYVVVQESIKFPAVGNSVQQAEIALVWSTALHLSFGKLSENLLTRRYSVSFSTRYWPSFLRFGETGLSTTLPEFALQHFAA